MGEYSVDPAIRAAHQRSVDGAAWMMVNTMDSNYPDLCAIRDKYPGISVSDAYDMIRRNNTPRSAAVGVAPRAKKKPVKNAHPKEIVLDGATYILKSAHPNKNGEG